MDVSQFGNIMTQHANALDKPDKNSDLYMAAQKLEEGFVADLLKYGGFSDALAALGGQHTDAFSSIYITQFAQEITRAGGVGLAEKIYQSLLSDEKVG